MVNINYIKSVQIVKCNLNDDAFINMKFNLTVFLIVHGSCLKYM